jgi:hypothetical protein
MKLHARTTTGFALFLLLAGTAFAHGMAFTYQGRLTDNGVAATGQYDLQFALFDAASNGVQQGNTLTREDVPVTNGVFTVALDFGAVFDGTARWLEIRVRPGASTGAFTPLTPLQPLSAAPYAVRSLQAGTADNATSLGGVAASSYLQTNGDGAGLTNLNAAHIASGTLADGRLSANVALRNTANTFAGNQTVNGALTQSGTVADRKTATFAVVE